MKSPLFLTLMIFCAAQAGAQQRSPAFGPRSAPPGPSGHFGGHHGGHHGGKFQGGFFPGFLVVEREVPVIVERVVERAPPPPAAAPLPQKSGGEDEQRKPYVIGASYASLPGGCLKMIEGSASYYYCGGGEWYRPVGKQFRAVARP